MEMILDLIAEIKWPVTLIIAILIIRHELKRRERR
jgi:hypothetical protein